MGWRAFSPGQTVQDQLERFWASSPTAASRRCAPAAPTPACIINQVALTPRSNGRELWHAAPTATRRTTSARQWARGCQPPSTAARAPPSRAATFWRQSSRSRRCARVSRAAASVGIPPARPGPRWRPPGSTCPVSTTSAASGVAMRQALSPPVGDLRRIDISRHGAYWRFEFEASASCIHMIRNIMGCLLAMGWATPPEWMLVEVREAREVAAPPSRPTGFYFLGPAYEPHWPCLTTCRHGSLPLTGCRDNENAMESRSGPDARVPMSRTPQAGVDAIGFCPLRQQPARAVTLQRRRARAPAAAPSSRRCCCPSTPAPTKSPPARGGAQRCCCSSTATRRPRNARMRAAGS